MRNNWRAQDVLPQGIATDIHWVAGHSGIFGSEQADRQLNLTRQASGITATERPHMLATNSA
jgi:ribonuclease HI